MDEKELERRLAELGETWRIPRDPPLERMWQAIEAQSFATRPPARWRRKLWLPLAAMLLLGFGLGRLSSPLRRGTTSGATAAASQPTAEASPASTLSTAPFVGVASDYLERVTALLVTLADANRRGQPLDAATLQARDLLATTRLLLDSPETAEPRLQGLLSDLELVLAQIVRLPHQAPEPDVYLIDQTVDQREVLPRLRELLAENSIAQP